MKRICVAFSLCVMLFFAFPAFGEQKIYLPHVVQSVINNLDFFTKPWVLWRYENCFLYDAKRLGSERMGLVLITPVGFEIRLVYGVNALDVLYLDMLIPEKSKRETMRHESISVAGAIKLAKSVVK